MNRHTVLIWFGCMEIFIGVNSDIYKDPWSKLGVQYSWRYLEYDFDSMKEKADAIQSGGYDFKNNFPVDVEVVPDGRIFVSILRESGAPATLTTFAKNTGHGSGPLLRPYPDWSWTNTSDCDNPIGVYGIAQDECNRLWVLDTGKIGDDEVCPPKLLAFDLMIDKLVQRIDIPKKFASNSNGKSLLTNLIIDNVGADCGDTNIYMSDTYGYGLVIWNGQSFWRIESPYFNSDPDAEDYSVNGIDFHKERGLLGMAITREEPNASDRLFYFRPLSSYNMYNTETAQLISKKDDQSAINYFTEPTKTTSQSVVQAFSSKGILFFSGTTEMSILCWNRHKPFIPENIVTVAQDKETLQWASGMKIYPGPPSETLWVLTDRWQEYTNDKMNFTKTNFRVLAGSVDDLVRGTNCE